MDLFNLLSAGLLAASAPLNLLCLLLGSTLGTVLGLLPGLGLVAAVALLWPATAGLAPLALLVLLLSLCCGVRHGRALRPLLAQRPGPGAALLGAHALALLVGAAFGTLLLVLGLPVLGGLAPRFGPTETAALMVLGLVGAVVLGPGALLKAIAMVLLGLLLGLVGVDGHSGLVRFAFDLPELGQGIDLRTLALGLCGYGPAIAYLVRPEPPLPPGVPSLPLLRLGRQDLLGLASAVLRGSVGAALPMLLWLPLAWGLAPHGALALADPAALGWGVTASLWLVGLLLVLSLLLLGLWARLLRLPYRWLFVVTVLLGAMGAYVPHHSLVDLGLLAGCGLLGYAFFMLGMEPVPLLLGFVLGPPMEAQLRQALLLSQGDWGVFVSRPLSASLLALAAALLLLVLWPPAQRLRQSLAIW